MDSPSGRPPGSFHWASTMWHELSHVYVLTATNHRVPRWFTEGMAVYEETAVAPDWGDRLDPEAINAIEGEETAAGRATGSRLRPAQLSVAGDCFLFPGGPDLQLHFAEMGLRQAAGDDALLRRLKTTPEVIQEDLGMSPEEFDKQFLAWLEAQTKNPVEHFAEWKEVDEGQLTPI